METVCIFDSDNEGQAQVVAEYLETQGIKAYVKNQYTQNLFGGLKIFTGFDPVVGSAQVYVRRDQEEEARAVLSDQEDQHALASDTEDQALASPRLELGMSDRDLSDGTALEEPVKTTKTPGNHALKALLFLGALVVIVWLLQIRG